MKQNIRLVSINIAVTALLLSSINLLSSAVLFVSGQIRMLLVQASPQAKEEEASDERLDRYILPKL